MNHIVVNRNMVLLLDLPNAIKTLRVLFNQILLVSYLGGFLDLFKSLVL